MTVFGKITKSSVTVLVRDVDGAMNVAQLEFDPFHMGLEQCPTCKKVVAAKEVDLMGECHACFNKGIDG
jgi:uncharacterized protein (UPF0212 family)